MRSWNSGGELVGRTSLLLGGCCGCCVATEDEGCGAAELATSRLWSSMSLLLMAVGQREE